MARAHFVDSILWNDTGVARVLSGATAHVYDVGTSTPISDTLYAAATGVDTLSNPLTADDNGKIEFYLENDRRVDLVISKTGYTSVRRTVNVLAADELDSPLLNSPTLAGTVSGTPTWASAQTFPGPTKVKATSIGFGSGFQIERSAATDKWEFLPEASNLALGYNGTTAVKFNTDLSVTLTNGLTVTGKITNTVTTGDIALLESTQVGTDATVRIKDAAGSASAGIVFDFGAQGNGAGVRGDADGTLGFFTAIPTGSNAANAYKRGGFNAAGLLTLTNGLTLTAGVLTIGATQVATSRRTGWGAPTGIATRTAFDTATVTTAQLAERVKALVDDLTTHGLIGA